MQTAKKGKRGRKAVILASSLFGIMMSQTALATVHPGTGSKTLFNVSEVSDSELAEMRGKFVAGGNVVYFGVEMATSWITANNEHFAGNIMFAVGGNHRRFVPTITYKVKQPQAAPNADTGPEPITTGGLDKAEGIVQAIQIAGAGNKVRNEISITLDKSGSGHEQPLQSTAGAGEITTSQQVLPAQTVSGASEMTAARQVLPAQTAAGVSDMTRSRQEPPAQEAAGSGQYVTQVLGSDKLALEFDVPGQGRISQSISDKQGLKQQVQLTSNFNNITNRVNIVAQLAGMQNNLNINNIRNAMSSVNTLQGIGRF